MTQVPGAEVAQSDACPTVPLRDSKNLAGLIVAIGADTWTDSVSSLPPALQGKRCIAHGHGVSKLVTASALSTRAAAKSS